MARLSNNPRVKVSKSQGGKKRKPAVDAESNDEEGVEAADDTDAQFLNILSNHIRHLKMSKRAKQDLQGEILAAIIEGDDQFLEIVAKVQASKTSAGTKLKLQGDILATVARHIT